MRRCASNWLGLSRNRIARGWRCSFLLRRGRGVLVRSGPVGEHRFFAVQQPVVSQGGETVGDGNDDGKRRFLLVVENLTERRWRHADVLREALAVHVLVFYELLNPRSHSLFIHDFEAFLCFMIDFTKVKLFFRLSKCFYKNIIGEFSIYKTESDVFF